MSLKDRDAEQAQKIVLKNLQNIYIPNSMN